MTTIHPSAHCRPGYTYCCIDRKWFIFILKLLQRARHTAVFWGGLSIDQSCHEEAADSWRKGPCRSLLCMPLLLHFLPSQLWTLIAVQPAHPKALCSTSNLPGSKTTETIARFFLILNFETAFCSTLSQAEHCWKHFNVLHKNKETVIIHHKDF